MEEMIMTGVALQITESTQVAQARRQLTTHARDLGFDETKTGVLAILITELASNLVKYGGGGEIIARTIGTADRSGIEILVLDKGPGMHNLEECLRDGHSSGGSPGTGLGAVMRMSDECQIYTLPEKGTAVMVRLWREPATTNPAGPLQTEGVSIPKPGESACGDGWTCVQNWERSVIMVVDGLGHGPLAESAARAAVEAFHETSDRDVETIISMIHGALRSTRGAAVAVARIDRNSRQVSYAGVGNIAGAIIAPEKTYRMVSHNGIAGHEVRKLQEFTYPWPEDSVLVMHSDGLSTQWGLDPYPGLIRHHPSLIAGVLYRDFSRGRDDATVVVARES